MTDYTPTTEDVISAYLYACHEHRRGGLIAEFNRWLNKVKADAWDEGKRAGLRQSDWEHGDTPTMYVAVNPYRKEQAEMNSDLAEAWEEGHEAAAMRVPEGVWHDVAAPRPANPYREEKDA